MDLTGDEVCRATGLEVRSKSAVAGKLSPGEDAEHGQPEQ